MIRTFTVVGGGSAYTPGLLAALLHHCCELELSEVRLFDIDAKNLDVVSRLGAKMAAAEGGPFTVRAYDDLDEALAGTDAVLNTSRPGGLQCRHHDETIPLEVEIPGQETVGPGGFFFALRSVPASLAIVDRLKHLAPEAVLLNYTNPTNIVTQALLGRGVRVIGLCDQSDEDMHDLAIALGREGEVRFDCVGLNHATWYHDVHIGGAPLPAIDSIEVPAHLDGAYRLRFEISLDLARSHPGYFPNSYLAFYARPEAFVAHALKAGSRAEAILAKLPAYFAHFEEEARRDTPVLQHHRGSSGFGDMAVHMLRALGSDVPQRMVLNVPGQGAAPIFDPTTVVESVCSVSKQEILRTSAPPVAPDQMPLLLRLERYQRRAAEAAVGHDVEAATAALADNPLVESTAKARTMMELAKRRYGAAIEMFA